MTQRQPACSTKASFRKPCEHATNNAIVPANPPGLCAMTAWHLALFPVAWYLVTAVPAMPPEVLHRES